MKGLQLKTLFLLLFLTSFLVAQGGKLTIKVTDAASNTPLPGAVIILQSGEYYSVADRIGEVHFSRLPEGETIVKCSFVGYASQVKKVQIVTGKSVSVNFIMNSEAVPVPDVIVSSTRGIGNDAAVSFSNISREEIDRLSGYSDMAMQLSTLPSIINHSENGNGIGYTYLRLRGFDQRRISVLINGIPQNDPEDHNVYWINLYDINSSLEDVQVQRGAGAAFYGPPAIGGSVNLVTAVPSSEPGFTFLTGLGSFNTRKFSLGLNSGLIGGHFLFSLRATQVYSGGYRNSSSSEFTRFFLKGLYLDDQQSLQFTFFGGPQRDKLAFYGIPKSFNSDETLRKTNYGEVSNDREYLHQPQVSLQHDFRINSDLLLKNTVFFMSGDGFFDFSGNWGTQDYFRIDTSLTIPSDLVMRAAVDNDQYGWLPQLEWNNSLGSFTAGAEIRFHRSIHYGRIESGSGLPASVIGEKADKRFYDYKGGKDIYSFYASQSAVFGRWNLSMNAQMVYQQYKLYDEKYVGTEFTTPYLFLNPQLGISYRVADETAVYSSIAVTRREPPLKNLYEAESASWGVVPQFEKNPDGSYNFNEPLVKPEELVNVEVGIRYSGSSFRVSGNIYWMEFINEIVPSGGLDIFGQPRVGNAERTRHIGLEIESAVRLLPGLDIVGNVSLSRNRYITFTEYDDAAAPVSRNGNYIANAPELISNLKLNYETQHIFGSLLWQHVGAQYVDNTQNPNAPRNADAIADQYSVINLHVGLRSNLLGREVSLSAEVHNLLNHKYLYIGLGRDNFFPAPERNFFVTLQIR